MGWLRRLFCSRRMERELDAELQHHLDLLVKAKMSAGLTTLQKCLTPPTLLERPDNVSYLEQSVQKLYGR